MEKDEVVQILRKKGYQVVNDRGVILIYMEEYSGKAEKTLRGLLKEIGYKSSFGIVGKGLETGDSEVSEEDGEETENVTETVQTTGEPQIQEASQTAGGKEVPNRKPEEGADSENVQIEKDNGVVEPEKESEESDSLEDWEDASMLYRAEEGDQLTFQW